MVIIIIDADLRASALAPQKAWRESVARGPWREQCARFGGRPKTASSLGVWPIGAIADRANTPHLKQHCRPLGGYLAPLFRWALVQEGWRSGTGALERSGERPQGYPASCGRDPVTAAGYLSPARWSDPAVQPGCPTQPTDPAVQPGCPTQPTVPAVLHGCPTRRPTLLSDPAGHGCPTRRPTLLSDPAGHGCPTRRPTLLSDPAGHGCPTRRPTLSFRPRWSASVQRGLGHGDTRFRRNCYLCRSLKMCSGITTLIPVQPTWWLKAIRSPLLWRPSKHTSFEILNLPVYMMIYQRTHRTEQRLNLR
ncbi:uncharacterized protein [Dermacentor albipictus]|uniref:uncharacterized protein n=1 Tax=Dermacentor albipictus TaxID=60249 RepID=UPI0038FCF82F